MRTQLEIMTEVLVRNNRSTTDTFITDAILRNWYTQAHTWAAAYHKWPFTEGKNSTTYTTAITDEMGNTIIQYPEGWKADSVRILTIGGKQLKKTEFNSFLRFIENVSLSGRNSARIYSDYARQIFVNTGADVSGTLTAYGQYQPYVDVTDDAALSIFSGFDEEGNEAIIEQMSSYLFTKEHLGAEATEHNEKAIVKLDELWKRIGDEQFNYKPKDQSMFEYFDVTRGRGPNNNDLWRTREDQF